MIVDPAGLAARARYRLMISCIVPRPIGLVSTRAKDGRRNVAPFSFFNGVTSTPPVVSVSIGARAGTTKDTLRNVREAGEFVVNVVDEALAERAVRASADLPPDADEFAFAGMTEAPSERVGAPGVAEAPVRLECRVRAIVPLDDAEAGLVLGDVLLVHVRDDLWADGEVDARRLQVVGRLGGDLYCRVRDLIAIPRPRV